jgi:hypothetical protein
MSTNTDNPDLDKAQSLAYWSFVGLVIPLLGWVLAGLSLHTFKLLPPEVSSGLKVRRLKRLAIDSLILSSLAFVVWASLCRYYIVNYQRQTCVSNAASERNKGQESDVNNHVNSSFWSDYERVRQQRANKLLEPMARDADIEPCSKIYPYW